MAKYPIKMLKDEEGTPFVPLVSTEALRTPEGETIEEKLEKKLEPSNLIAGTDITLSVDGNNITINNASKGVIIDNLTTEQSGVGSLDAHQGKVLKDMIPDVVDNLTTVSTDKALSAYQGYLLNHKVVPTGGTTGQVLKKSSNDDHALEWGDAADPNAIVGDGSIKKIVELTYEEYQALETIGPDTEYHIIDYNSKVIVNQIFGQLTNSDTDTYSCNFINAKNDLFDNFTFVQENNTTINIDDIEQSGIIQVIDSTGGGTLPLGLSQNSHNYFLITLTRIEDTPWRRQILLDIRSHGIYTRHRSSIEGWSEWTSLNNSYSNNETVIGTWVNGEPLYRKVINIGSLTPNSKTTYSTGLSNIHVKKYEGFFQIGSNVFCLNHVNNYNRDSSLYESILLYPVNNGEAIIIENVNVSIEIPSCWVIMEYTK